MLRRLFLLLTISIALGACGRRSVQRGGASWYGPGFLLKRTASGKRYKPWRRTAAHKTLPFGTVVRVRRTDTGRSVRVVITDRGPFVSGRVIDLSRRAARRVRLIDDGVAPVELTVVGCRRRFDGCR